MPTDREWSVAYARQASSDMAVRDLLLMAKDLPACQQLHYLQMACEKLCKAHIFAAGDFCPDIQRSHGYIAGVLPSLIRMKFSQEYGRKLLSQSAFLKKARHLAREIELLAPAVKDNGRRQDNCEYPWEDRSGTVVVPVDHTYPNLELLFQSHGRQLLTFIKATIRDFCKPSVLRPTESTS